MEQYLLVPVAEHPLFPGSSQALQLSKDQYEILKENEKQIFASVVKNDEIFKKEKSLISE
jgi:hypothetical protein